MFQVRWAVALLTLHALLCGDKPAIAEILLQRNVLTAGVEGFSVYRIPGFTVAPDGSLLLFAEGRPGGADPGAPGDIEMVFKRSTDGGLTWSDLQVLHATSGFDYSDPRVVVDSDSGTIHLQYAQWPTLCGQACVPAGLGDNSSVIFHQTSTDNGLTWSGPMNINAQVKERNWSSLNTGPGVGIQLQWQDSAPERNGRLLMPGHVRPPSYRGVSIYSDDGGLTWTHGSGFTPNYADESEVVELTNGDLLWDARRSGSGRNRSISHDGGDTWVDAFAGEIPVTAVDSGLIRYSAQRAGEDRDRILFSAPLGDPAGSGNSRSNIGVWTSYDEGNTFINPVQIESGSAAYSVINRMPDGTIGLVYEVNHNTIRYVHFDLAELEKADHPTGMSHYDGFGNQIDPFRGGVGWSGAWTHSGAAVVPGVLEFPGFLTEDDGQHVRLRDAAMSRSLGTGSIDLNQHGGHYFSLFVQHDSRDGDNGGSEYLDILLQDSAGVTKAAFGVGSSENFFINHVGGTVSSPSNTLALDSTYLLLAKLATNDDTQNQHFDQLFLAWYDDPKEVPASEAEIEWQLVGDITANIDGTIQQLAIRTGSNADWLLDGLRMGTTFDAVVHDTGIGLPPVLGDLNRDGVLDLADWVELKNNFRFDTSALAEDEQLQLGDFDQSGQVGFEDFLAFRELFESVHGQGSLSGAVVPEPESLVLVGGALLLLRGRAMGFRR
ncbi:exo-alpha-sialidase [Aeoliella mucimassa]|uniref:exo-alpha-sialidase n=1 Tax=Aeoliella mucimassa TaxID=2527972 RepID=A0A518AQI6_9BACT|nr:exo-alpha-sialidase [Aeoliella mucimassa]QDU56983.1 Sialidase precursor [Aeoliella mucimassa]